MGRKSATQEFMPPPAILAAEVERLRNLGFVEGDVHGLVTKGHREALSILAIESNRALQGLAQGAADAFLDPRARRRAREWDAMCAIARKASVAAVALMLVRLRADIQAAKQRWQQGNTDGRAFVAQGSPDVVPKASWADVGDDAEENAYWANGVCMWPEPNPYSVQRVGGGISHTGSTLVVAEASASPSA